MRNPASVLVLTLALAACDKPQSNVAVPPPQAPIQPPVAAKAAEPPPVPQPSPSAQLAAKIKSALRSAKNMDAQGVDVTVADGVVTLHGTVAEAKARQQIAAYVAQMDGVRSVVNNLVVIRGS